MTYRDAVRDAIREALERDERPLGRLVQGDGIEAEGGDASGRRLRVGVDPGRPSVVYAAEIGPGSEWFSINHNDAWQVTDANRSLWIANPNAAPITYSLWIVGTSVAPA